jgi:hypothetical protein
MPTRPSQFIMVFLPSMGEVKIDKRESPLLAIKEISHSSLFLECHSHHNYLAIEEIDLE